MTEKRKYETLREDGIEVLRAGRSVSGFDGMPGKIADFYLALAEASVKGAMERLNASVRAELEGARTRGAGALAFFRRYNYFFDCRGEVYEEDILKVTVSVSLTRGGGELYSVKNAHFWNISEQSMIGEGHVKKAVLKHDKFVKK